MHSCNISDVGVGCFGELLRRVEAKFPMRLASIVVEMAMRKSFEESPRFLDRYGGMIQGGWVVTDKRRLMKIVYGAVEVYRFSEIDSKVLEHFSGEKTVVIVGVELMLEGAVVRSNIQMRRVICNEGIVPDDFSAVAKRISRRVDAWFSENPLGSKLDIAEHIEAWGLGELKEILAQRCVINVLDRPVADLDGFVIDRRSGALALIEMKRKSPARNFYPADIKSLKPFFDRLRKGLDGGVRGKCKGNLDRKFVDGIVSSEGYVRTHGRCFGLDEFHAETLQWVSGFGIYYVYVVMLDDSNPSRDFVGQQELLTALVQKGKFIEPRDWWVCSSVCDEFSGFTFTAGADSGSYGGGVRWQVIIPYSKGKESRRAK